MLKNLSSSINIKKSIVIIAVFVCTMLPFYNILIKGVYKWHITQPEFWQGGIEILLFVLFSMFFSYKNNSKLPIIIFVFGSIYLSMNGVIIPFLTVYVYFECLLYIGFTLNSIKKNYCCGSVIENFISGISIWGMFAIICSVCKFGTFNDLRIMTALLVGISFVVNKNKKYEMLFRKIRNFILINNTSLFSKITIVLLCFLVLALGAKSNTTQCFDSLWYGLRPEHVLIGENSFFDYLGYAAFVYYYPKLMELLFVPISNLGDYSFIIIGNIFVYSILLGVLYRMLKNILKLNNKNNFIICTWILIIIGSIPAITGMATSAKPDILGALFCVSAFMFFLEYENDKMTIKIIFAFVSLLLSTGTKLTYLLWGGILFLYIILNLIKNSDVKKLISEGKRNIIFILSSIIFIFGIHYRTFKLTGYPLYPSFINVFKKIGFKGIYPAFTTRSGSQSIKLDFNYIINRLYQAFFDPNQLAHIIMLWISTITIFMLILYVILVPIQKIKNKNLMSELIYVVLNLLIMCYYIISMNQPDGNYFILPIIVIIIISIKHIKYFFNNVISRKILTFILAMFVCLHIPIMFVSSPSWAIGTKKFTDEIVVNNFETPVVNKEIYKINGYSKIADYIENNMKGLRIITSAQDLTIINRINGDIETFGQLSDHMQSNSEITNSYSGFLKYIRHANIRGFLLLDEDQSIFKEYVEKYVDENKVKIIDDEKGKLYLIDNEKIDGYKRLDVENVWDDKWLPINSHFKINTYNDGIIVLKGYYPYNIDKELTGVIYVNDVPNKFEITSNNFEIKLNANKNSTVKINIKCDFDRQASESDTRRVSFILDCLQAS